MIDNRMLERSSVYVLTVDQIASRSSPDRAESAIDGLNERYGDRLLLPADRTAGDEFQLATDDAALALTIALELVRDAGWSVGVGQGSARTPLPTTTRAATGEAFYAARDAVTRAKKAALRFALEASDAQRGSDLEALIVLLLHLRERRTDGGWEVADLLASGATQAEAAERLGLTESSVSRRVAVAGLRAEAAATAAIVRLLSELDAEELRNRTIDREETR